MVLHLMNIATLTGPHVVMVTLNWKIISLLVYICNFATVMNHHVNTWHAVFLICDPQRGHDPHELLDTIPCRQDFWDFLVGHRQLISKLGET